MQAANTTEAAAAAIAWATAHPAEMAWLADNMERNDFAASLARQLAERGSLSPRQQEVLAEKVRAQFAQAAAPVLNIGEIEARFATARQNGIEKPSMHLAEFQFKAAAPGGRNDGAIYVTTESDGGSVYLGKVLGGRFLKVGACTPEQEARVAAVASNPDEEARAYGQRTGRCCICRRKLTAEESIDSFVGPICADKYGLPWGKAAKQ